MKDRAIVLAHFLDAARGAAELVMRVYAEADVGLELKGPHDPVTKADKEANAFLIAHLSAAMPGLPIVAEESDPSTFAGFANERAAVFVDPVDGTHDFVAKNGEFCIMLGFAEEGRATVGVVVCPAFEGVRRTFGAAEGIGAFSFDENGARTPLRVSSTLQRREARCAISRFHRSAELDAKLAALGCSALVPVGSAGIKGVQVARGVLDIYAHPSRRAVNLWDACAPDALVRAAGGVFTDAEGTPFDYRGAVAQGRGMLAANHALHADVQARFAAYDAGTTEDA